MPSFAPSSIRPRLATAALLAAVLAGPVLASDYVLGPMDSLAIDQPRITFGLSDETDPNNPILIGPTLQNLALLDTGANGILLGQLSFADDENYQQPTFINSMGQPELATYDEQGVAGFETLDVFSPYALRLLDSVGTELIAAQDVIAFGGDDIVLGSFAAIVGMPAMAGRVVDIDLRPMLDLEFQTVAFYDQIDEVAFESAASLNIDLRMIAPVYTDLDLPAEMQPTFAALPVIDQIALTHTGGANGGPQPQSTANTYLMDTGAQTTIISEAMAAALGINIEEFVTNGGDVVDVLEVGGIGGTAFMPLVVVDELRLPTADGIDLVFTNVITGVLDIEGAPFDAVLGMNTLTSGYFSEVFGGGGAGGLTNPAVDKETLDLFLDVGTVSTVEDLFTFGIITLSQEDFDLLVDVGLLTDPTDPRVVFCELRLLDDQAGPGTTGTYFDRVVFDFTATDGTGIMRVDLTSLHEAGDANYDDVVGIEDLDIILANWGASVRAGSVLDGDLTGDGLVNQDDLNLVLANWGNSFDPGTVPEPATALLLLAGLGLAGRRHRRR